jgi:hypothetical protein
MQTALMRFAPTPANEAERLEALRSCGILDSEPEPQFDEIAKLASQLCAVPMALVSLIDAEPAMVQEQGRRRRRRRRRAMSRSAPTRSPRASRSSCPTPSPTTASSTTRSSSTTRASASTPASRWSSRGASVAGTLCVLDRVPRDITPGQFDALGMLAKQVTTELKLRRRLAAAQAQARGEAAAQADAPVAGPHHARTPLPQESVIAERYRVDRLLGAGGMGVVVAAEDLKTGGPVAIKFLLREEMKLPDGRERFVREARALLRLASEHVVRILDVGNLANGAPFIVMEYLEGEDLRARLAATGPGQPREVVDLMLQACEAVRSAHACGIVHRDLKPANLFLERREDGGTTLKVLDFGVSKLQDAATREDAALTGANMMVGSVYYMAPEQMENGRDSDARADIWSLGVILYEALAGVRPFEGESVAEVCAQVMLFPHTPLELRRPDLPPQLCEVVARCLNKDRDQRYATAEALREALLACR